MQNQFDYKGQGYRVRYADFIPPETVLWLQENGLSLDINDYDFCYIRRTGDKNDKWELNKTFVVEIYSFPIDVIPALSFTDILRLLPASLTVDEEDGMLELKWNIRTDIERGKVFSFGYGPIGRSSLTIGFENSNPVDAISELLTHIVSRYPQAIRSNNLKS